MSLSDLEIARRARLQRIESIAESLGILPDELEPYGRYKGKIALHALDRFKDKPNGRYICVTGINPTPLGEGKTVVTIGLAQALRRLGRRAISTLRQPSMGPVFGIKGGATGGGHSQVVPMDEINLHFTGDFHAVALKLRAQFAYKFDSARGVAVNTDRFAAHLDILAFNRTHLAFAQHPQYTLGCFIWIMKQCVRSRARDEPAII